MQISGRAPELSSEQREKRNTAKRIIKVIQPELEGAIRKESELNRQQFEQELKDLDVMLGDSVYSGRGSEIDAGERATEENLEKPEQPENADRMDVDPEPTTKQEAQEAAEQQAKTEATQAKAQQPLPSEAQGEAEENASAGVPITDATSAPAQPSSEHPPFAPGVTESSGIITSAGEQANPPLQVPRSPPPIQGGQHQTLDQGGVPWYIQPFDPVGTTIHEERWTGREVMRGLSEELSELDEEELNDLVDGDELDENAAGSGSSAHRDPDNSNQGQGTRVRRTRRRWRGSN